MIEVKLHLLSSKQNLSTEEENGEQTSLTKPKLFNSPIPKFQIVPKLAN